MIENEKAIRALVKTAVESYAQGFETRHITEFDAPAVYDKHENP